MKKLSLIGLPVFIAAAAFADCDCTIVPFKPDPPCYERCVANFLSKANYAQLTRILKLPPEVSHKILSVPNRSSATSLAPFEEVLNKQEILVIRNTFNSLTKERIQAFESSQKKAAERGNEQ